jgi:hypothetical protein
MQDQKASAARVKSALSGFSLPSGGSSGPRIGDQRTTKGDSFGSRKAQPTLEFGDPGAETESDNARAPFDTAGEKKAPETTASDSMAGPPSAPAGNPRLEAADRELAGLKLKRAQMDAEIAELARRRNSTKDPAEMKALTAQLDQKEKDKQANAVEIVKSEKRHREIETEVAPASPAGKPAEKGKASQ